MAPSANSMAVCTELDWYHCRVLAGRTLLLSSEHQHGLTWSSEALLASSIIQQGSGSEAATTEALHLRREKRFEMTKVTHLHTHTYRQSY